jgi:hypothetical protein
MRVPAVFCAAVAALLTLSCGSVRRRRRMSGLVTYLATLQVKE